MPEAKDDDSDETVSKSTAETSKTHETVNKMSDLEPSGETWAGEAKFLENEEAPQNNIF